MVVIELFKKKNNFIKMVLKSNKIPSMKWYEELNRVGPIPIPPKDKKAKEENAGMTEDQESDLLCLVLSF